jgi:membrane protease YdiL (CAAX protease family)
LSVADTAVLIGLIVFFLRAHGENPRAVFLGRKTTGREVLVGIGLTFVVFLVALAVLGAVLVFAPQLHTVANNPLKDLMRTPRQAAVFAVVVVLAGGVREELQRAFLLHRFDRWLGGGKVGIVATSVAFGLGHLTQGLDAAIATGVIGACWGVVYLRRRSVVAPIVSHSGFDLLQLLQFTVLGL